jgi:RNA polymerase sigma factor (sigma-70 family)
MSTVNYAEGGPGMNEATLFAEAQAGCQSSLNWLMSRHDGLVQAVVRRQVLGELPFVEALQAGRIGLWRAIMGYDPQRGTTFSTYAWPSIMRHIWREVKQERRVRLPAQMAAEGCATTNSEADPAVAWEGRVVHTSLHRLVERLPDDRLRYIVMARYGLAGEPPASYRQIGTVWSLSGERARQLHVQALVWLRHPAHSHTLRSMMGRHGVCDYRAADAQAQGWLRQRAGRHAG